MTSLVDTNREKNDRLSVNNYALFLFIKEDDKTH